MFLLVVSLIIVLPFVELWVIIQVSRDAGLLPTIALLIAISIVGTSVIKREGLKVYREFTAAIARGQEPSRQVVHGVCLLAAGVLMLAPGFISDCAALLLMLPPTRNVIARIVLRGSRSRITVIRATHTGPIVDVRGDLGRSSGVIDVEPHEGDDQR